MNKKELIKKIENLYYDFKLDTIEYTKNRPIIYDAIKEYYNKDTISDDEIFNRFLKFEQNDERDNAAREQ